MYDFIIHWPNIRVNILSTTTTIRDWFWDKENTYSVSRAYSNNYRLNLPGFFNHAKIIIKHCKIKF